MEAIGGHEVFLPPPEITRGNTVVGMERLNPGRGVGVVRLALDGPAGPASLIAKYLEAGSTGICPRERLYFGEEALNYRFLEGLRDRFCHAPKLLGEAQDCFYLEDLGRGEPRQPDGAVLEQLAAALVWLHAATRGELHTYVRLREELGYPPREADLRVLHPGSDESSFRVGAKLLVDWSSVLLPAPSHALLASMVGGAKGRMDEEQHEHAFIHSDLVSARQCVLRGGALFLVDFEHGRYGHRLLDLAKVMMGKLEITPEGRLLHVHPSVPAGIGNVYRTQWQRLCGGRVSDATWRAQLSAALWFQAVAEIGQCTLRASSDFVLGLRPTIRSFLQRLHQHLTVIDSGGSCHPVLEQLLLRMAMPGAGLNEAARGCPPEP